MQSPPSTMTKYPSFTSFIDPPSSIVLYSSFIPPHQNPRYRNPIIANPSATMTPEPCFNTSDQDLICSVFPHFYETAISQKAKAYLPRGCPLFLRAFRGRAVLNQTRSCKASRCTHGISASSQNSQAGPLKMKSDFKMVVHRVVCCIGLAIATRRALSGLYLVRPAPYATTFLGIWKVLLGQRRFISKLRG